MASKMSEARGQRTAAARYFTREGSGPSDSGGTRRILRLAVDAPAGRELAWPSPARWGGTSPGRSARFPAAFYHGGPGMTPPPGDVLGAAPGPRRPRPARPGLA